MIGVKQRVRRQRGSKEISWGIVLPLFWYFIKGPWDSRKLGPFLSTAHRTSFLATRRDVIRLWELRFTSLTKILSRHKDPFAATTLVLFAIMQLSHAAAKLASTAVKSTTAARGFHSSSALEARKFFVGGNWKCNGSVQQVNDLISMLNQSTLSTDTEVVVCPSQLFVQGVKNGLRGDVAVGSQDVWTGGNGAYTGETSADMLAGKLFCNLLSN